jgi:lipopolysaccharide export LptBFGC system permease protein LptF
MDRDERVVMAFGAIVLAGLGAWFAFTVFIDNGVLPSFATAYAVGIFIGVLLLVLYWISEH